MEKENSLRGWAFAVVFAAVALFATCPLVQDVYADKYPSKQITVIVPFSAGGGSDTFARIVSKYAPKYIGQKFVVKNITGAGGARGINEFLKFKPDGYTLATFPFTLEIFQPALRKPGQKGYQKGDVIWIGTPSAVPSALMVHKDSKIKTLDDLITKAKANPGKVTFTQTGQVSVPAAFRRQVEKKLNIQTAGLNYKGGSKAFKALLGKEIEVLNANVMFGVRAPDKVRVLAVAGKERYVLYPDAPTFQELGYDVVDFYARSICAPKGTPEQLIAYLNKKLMAICRDPDFQASLKKAGLAPVCWDARQTVKEQDEYAQRTGWVINEFKQLLGH